MTGTARPARFLASYGLPLALVALLALALGALALIGNERAQRRDAATGGDGSPLASAPGDAPPLASLPATDGSAKELGDESTVLAPTDARARNAAVPFAVDTPRPAAPFRFAGGETDRARATECLALAAMAEAGAGDTDQRAVMQVILNRVRHPAFPRTVCGVVFEGSQRRTGCQFTFTCDGSLARVYSDARWQAARSRAREMLGGKVYGAVGNATHYHTDWVYPWWSGKLDKIAKVDTHLFFRWRGYWGTQAAQRLAYRGGEPAMSGLIAQVREAAATADAPALVDTGEPVLTIGRGRQEGTFDAPGTSAPGSPSPGVHFVLVGSGDAPGALLDRARSLCSGGGYCQVYGWSDAGAIPAALPLPDDARRSLRFSFVPSRSGREIAYFDCEAFSGVERAQCLPKARN